MADLTTPEGVVNAIIAKCERIDSIPSIRCSVLESLGQMGAHSFVRLHTERSKLTDQQYSALVLVLRELALMRFGTGAAAAAARSEQALIDFVEQVLIRLPKGEPGMVLFNVQRACVMRGGSTLEMKGWKLARHEQGRSAISFSVSHDNWTAQQLTAGSLADGPDCPVLELYRLLARDVDRGINIYKDLAEAGTPPVLGFAEFIGLVARGRIERMLEFVEQGGREKMQDELLGLLQDPAALSIETIFEKTGGHGSLIHQMMT